MEAKYCDINDYYLRNFFGEREEIYFKSP